MGVYENLKEGKYNVDQEKFPFSLTREQVRVFEDDRDNIRANFVGTMVQIEAKIAESKENQKKAEKEVRAVYYAETFRIEEEFKKDLFEEADVVGHPKADKLYSKAYERGHSSGFSEIANYFFDMVDLIKD